MHDHRSTFALLSLWALPLSLMGCTPPNECVPGETQECLGSGRCLGVQSCVPEGTGFGGCACEDEGGEDGGLPDVSSPDLDTGGETGGDAGPAEDGGGTTLPQELKAFPTAFGAGADVTGGRGGQVVQVTRLDDAYVGGEPMEGTFRYALSRTFPRTIVFRVSGTIVLGDRDGDGVVDTNAGNRPSLLALESDDYSDVTVAGQTAPEGGVTIRGAIYLYGVHNQIWRYVRVRVSDSEAIEQFAAFTSRDGERIIMDHVSSAYGGQQAVSITNFAEGPNQEAATLQFSLLALAKNGSIMGASGGPNGTTTVHNNMYTHLSHRVPNLAGAQSFEVVNNLTYDWRFRLINVHDALTLNHLGNAYVAGPNTQEDLARLGHKVNMGVENTDDARIHTADNFISFAPESDPWDAWGVFLEDGTPAPTSMRADEPFARHPHPVPIRTAARIIEALPGEVGAFRTLDELGQVVTYRDAIDARLLEEFAARTSSANGRPADGLDYPAIPSSEPYADADADGMPDAWERSRGLDPDEKDGADDPDNDGYTNLEDFLNQVDLATVYD